MPKLTDTQTILLSTASRHADLSIYPLPDTHANGGPRVAKALAALASAGLAEERETRSADMISRTDGDLSYGLFVTPAGLAAIGVQSTVEQQAEPAAAIEPAAADEPTPTPAATAPRATKAALVLSLLQRADGATLPELIAATGWLPHTTRAALTGLRKKGHTIERGKREGATCYRIEPAA